MDPWWDWMIDKTSPSASCYHFIIKNVQVDKKNMTISGRTNTEDNGSLLDHARDYIHEKVKTQEQRDAERPVTEKIKDNFPNSAEDAGSTLGKKIDNIATDFKEKFNERLDEGTERAQQHTDETKREEDFNVFTDAAHASKEKIHDVRESIFDATKTPAEKDQEAFLEKPLHEKLKEMPHRMAEVEESKKDDTMPPFAQLGWFDDRFTFPKRNKPKVRFGWSRH